MRPLYLDGVAFWAPTMPGWSVARAAFRGEGGRIDPPSRRPAPQILAAAERRRAPDTVALALEVASQAVAQSGLDAADLASVFVSAQGDLGVNDYMCGTLASDPLLISPTRFHNSVHNAAAGYWTIATGCMAPSNALTAFDHSFAAGLLEAATQCAVEERPVLLVAFDIEACGALASVTRSRGLLACALVLSPAPGPRSSACLALTLQPGPTTPPELRSPPARELADNAMADALPMFDMLACDVAATLCMPLSAALSLQVAYTPGATT